MNKYFIPDMQRKYDESEESKTMNTTEYGLIYLKKIVSMRRRGLISKTEYNLYRKAIETQLFRI